MIRAIFPSELTSFAELGRRFFKQLGLPGEFNHDSFCSTWKKLIDAGTGFILARFKNDQPVEALGIILHPDVFSGALTACTAFWFFSEEPKGLEAGMLYNALELDCRHLRVARLNVGALCDSRLPKVGGHLLKNGYQLVEMTYRKEICPKPCP